MASLESQASSERVQADIPIGRAPYAVPPTAVDVIRLASEKMDNSSSGKVIQFLQELTAGNYWSDINMPHLQSIAATALLRTSLKDVGLMRGNVHVAVREDARTPKSQVQYAPDAPAPNARQASAARWRGIGRLDHPEKKLSPKAHPYPHVCGRTGRHDLRHRRHGPTAEVHGEFDELQITSIFFYYLNLIKSQAF